VIVIAGRLDDPTVPMTAQVAAARGARVEVVATARPGEAGDGQLLELAKADVGHAAMLRSPAADLEPADLELALRYLPDTRVVVLVRAPLLAATAATAAAWSGAALLLVSGATDPGLPGAVGAADRVIEVAAPDRDPDGAFAGLLADLAVRVDAGEGLREAWEATAAALGVEPVSGPRADLR
jgi:hypothetical protein